MITTKILLTRKYNNNDKHLQNHTSLNDVTLASGAITQYQVKARSRKDLGTCCRRLTGLRNESGGFRFFRFP